MGWKSLSNGAMLDKAVDAGFALVITGDGSMTREQSHNLGIALATGRYDDHVAQIEADLRDVQADRPAPPQTLVAQLAAAGWGRRLRKRGRLPAVYVLDDLAEAFVHLSAHGLKAHIDFDAEQVDVVLHSVYFGVEPSDASLNALFHAVHRISGHRSDISSVHAFSLREAA